MASMASTGSAARGRPRRAVNSDSFRRPKVPLHLALYTRAVARVLVVVVVLVVPDRDADRDADREIEDTHAIR